MSRSWVLLLLLVELSITSASIISHLSFSLFRRQNNNCAEYMVVFARGTSEPPPLGKVGTPLMGNLSQAVGPDNLNFIGIAYDADVTGYLEGGDETGSSNMAATATGALNSCPDANVVLVGYSQGAQLVHNAVQQLAPDHASRLSSVVTFGDPDRDAPMANIDAARIRIYCHDGDLICEGQPIILDSHRTYGSLDAANAASFILSHGTNTTSSSSSSSSTPGISKEGAAQNIGPQVLLLSAVLFLGTAMHMV